MKYHVAEETIAYTGEQLHSNFALTVFGILGDSIVAFCGPCDVRKDKIVDIEDLRAGNRIYSERMLHFIVEHHDTGLEKNVLRQIMLVNIIKDSINARLGGLVVRREHTDLYDGDAKLSVSVATASPVSSLIHFGINISSANTPVKTRGLDDYRIAPADLARRVVEEYARDTDRLYTARCKVKWVE